MKKTIKNSKISKKQPALHSGSNKNRRKKYDELNKTKLLNTATKMFEKEELLTLSKKEVMTIIDKFDSRYTPKTLQNHLFGLRVLMKLAAEIR